MEGGDRILNILSQLMAGLLIVLYGTMIFAPWHKLSDLAGYSLSIVSIITLIYIATNKPLRSPLTLNESLLLLFVASVTLSAVITEDQPGKQLKHGLYAALPFMAICRANSHAIISLCGRAFFIIATFASAYFIVGWLGESALNGKISRLGAASHQAYNPVHLSHLILIGLFPKLYQHHRRENTSAAELFAAGVIFLFMVIVMFQSRNILIGITCLFAICLLEQDKAAKKAWLVITISAVTVIGLYCIDGLSIIMERGFSYRDIIWAEAITFQQQNCSWWFGCGKNIDIMFNGHNPHPHSSYLSTLFYYGLISLMLFLAFLVFSMGRVSFIASSGWASTSIIMLGAYTVSSNGPISSFNPAWAAFWIPLFFAHIEHLQHKKRKTPQQQTLNNYKH